MTAVDDSAALWQRAPEAMLDATELHDRAVRAQLAAHGGREVRRASDEGFVIAFDDSVSALRFCFATQAALLSVDWPEELLAEEEARVLVGDDKRVLLRGLRVSMGLHRGSSIERKDPATGRVEYFGPAVGRAAELADLARAGQVLAEKEVADSVRAVPHVARTVTVADSAPLICLVPPELAARPYPSESGERSVRSNLARERTSFVGRERDLDAIYRVVGEGSAIVTLVGAGGIGKTRVARHFAALALAELANEGGAWFCDLQAARTRDEMLRSVASALEVPLDAQASIDDLVDRIGGVIDRRGKMLLVLDNFEQLDQASARVVERWAERSRDTLFIVTSRSRIGAAGEAVVEISPMTKEDALELFLARARAAGATLSETGAEGAAILDVIARLEYIPLAIELAAARTRILPPPILRDRLSSGLDVLRSPGTTGKHSTLRATVRWSWDLLSPVEQSALAQCSVFRGGFTLEAAEAVLSLEGAGALDVLETLVEKSLVRTYDQRDGEARFGLYQSILEFTSERLSASGLREETHARHAAHYLEAGKRWVAGLTFENEVKNFELLVTELDNLNAVCERSFDSAPLIGVQAALIIDTVVNVRGPFEPHAALLTKAAAAAERAGDVDLFAKVRLQRARCYMGLGRFVEANTECDLALAVNPDKHTVGEIYSSLGAIYRFRGHIPAARVAHEKSRVAFEESGACPEEGELFGRMALVEHGDGNLEKARELYERALSRHREVGRTTYEALDLANYGLLELERGEPERARAHFERAIEIHRRLGLRRWEGIATGHLALAEHEASRLTQARAYCDRAIELHRDVGDRRFEGLLRIQKGYLAYEEGDLDEAQELFLKAIDLGDQAGDAVLAVFGTVSLGLLQATVGKKQAARAAFTSAKLRLAGEHGSYTIDNVSALQVLMGVSTADEAEAERKAILESREQPVPGSESGPPPFSARLIESRFGLRLMRRALAVRAARAQELGVELDKAETSLEVGPEGQWFRPPRGQRVDLGRRYVLRRLLMTLVRLQLEKNHELLDVDDALKAGWPGEVLGRKAAANRVRVAIATLRKLGLRRLLLTEGEGYRLDPEVPIVTSTS